VIQGRIIVCIASAWDYAPTGKHHIMRCLAEHNDIVWVEYHGTRRPSVTGSDLRAAWSAVRRFARGARRIGPSFMQITPLVLPAPRGRRLGQLNGMLLARQIRRAVRALSEYESKPIQVWSFAPDVPHLVGRLKEECFIYYCVDEYSEFEDLDADRIRAAECELLDRADVVLTASEPLWQAKRRRRADAVLARHGVDFEHFASAWRYKLDPPADIVSVPKPILGFFGLIHHWIDTSLLVAVARLRPAYSFVLLGDCRAENSALRQQPNVYLLGRRPYADLPRYCATFRAALLPFGRNAMTRHINPIKMYEYLAAGLPVVSTPLPEAERYRGPIRIAETAEGFAKACDEALAAADAGGREAVSRVVEHESWPSKVETLSQVVMQRSVHKQT